MLSIAKGAADVPLLEMTLGEALSVAARRWGSELALVSRHQNICWSWQELNREANTLCSKSNAVELTAIGLDLKAVIDQFREQVQNLE